jgi:LPXTG-motif cell wall-anchored protein
MSFPCRRPRLAVTAAAVTVALAVFSIAPAAHAASPAASAFGANVQVSGQDVVPPTPAVSVATAPGDQTNTVIDIPASPVAVNGTLTATANAHNTADIATGLTVVQQAVAGPYNARGLAQIEGAGVLYDVAGVGVPLLSAAVIRSEAAVVCGATPKYTANSEIVDLAIAGNSIPLNAPAQDLIDAINGVLATSGLNAVANVERNVVTQIAGGGIGVDALVVTVLSAAGATPLATVRLAHAEVTAAACAAKPQCSDGVDNDGDAVIDTADPGCHTDGNAANASTYVPTDNDETNEAARAVRAAALPRTGSEAGFPLAFAGLVTLGAAGMRLRRRFIG